MFSGFLRFWDDVWSDLFSSPVQGTMRITFRSPSDEWLARQDALREEETALREMEEKIAHRREWLRLRKEALKVAQETRVQLAVEQAVRENRRREQKSVGHVERV